MQPTAAVEKVLRRLDALGAISDESGNLTRMFASPAMHRANELTASWMTEAGMTVRQDAIGNLIGHFPGKFPGAKKLLLGSHLDTVRNAGKFDGPLGIVIAISCVEQLRAPLPFAIEVVAFADEEGLRYQTPYLGSRALAGSFDLRDLERSDANGITMREVINNFGGDAAQIESCRIDPSTLIGYAEVHIEQGPVLQERDHAVGIVSAIAGQTRARIEIRGVAGHAGTVPMALRKDALCAAAELVLAVEKRGRKTSGLVATAGKIEIAPNASNVIPSEVILTLDIRHHEDIVREVARNSLMQTLIEIGERRRVRTEFQIVQETSSSPCSPELSALLRTAAAKHQPEVITLASGAGHDAAVMAAITPVAMLFVRCKDGVSHHPDESVLAADVGVAISVLSDFISLLAAMHEHV
jgi:allantoate deiminase